MTVKHNLVSAALAELRPTQITVGIAEVATKRVEWEKLKPKERSATLASHWFPAVRGPGGLHYIVDHHHLGLALHEENVEKVWVMQLDDLSDSRSDQFWRLMEFHRWAHPYNEKGKRLGFDAIPQSVAQLRDDPYRSLAGFVRKAGGYAKDAEAYTEFLWADHFRPLIPVKDLKPSNGEALPQAAVQRAVEMARSADARFLPGWTGVSAATPSVPAAVPDAKPKSST
jgi:hypothetical protein